MVPSHRHLPAPPGRIIALRSFITVSKVKRRLNGGPVSPPGILDPLGPPLRLERPLGPLSVLPRIATAEAGLAPAIPLGKRGHEHPPPVAARAFPDVGLDGGGPRGVDVEIQSSTSQAPTGLDDSVTSGGRTGGRVGLPHSAATLASAPRLVWYILRSGGP